MVSKVWNFYIKISNDLAKCKECSKHIWCTGSNTSRFSRQLMHAHNIDVKLNRNSNTKNNQSLISFPKKNQISLGEIFSRSASIDGMSINAMLNSNSVKAEVKMFNLEMPKSFQKIKKEILNFFEESKNEYKLILNEKKIIMKD